MADDLDLREVEVGCTVNFPFAIGYVMAKDYASKYLPPHIVIKFPDGSYGNVFVDLQNNSVITFDVVQDVH